MPERITVRLDDAVYGRLTDAAQKRGLSLSDVVRLALQTFLDGQANGMPPGP